MSGQVRHMDVAFRDGRHVLLVPRDRADWSGYRLWAGGLISSWSADDRWWVCKTPDAMNGGSGEHADSFYFIGWMPLPDEKIPDLDSLEALP